MIPNVGPLEILIVVVVALVVFGPKRLFEPCRRPLGERSAAARPPQAVSRTATSYRPMAVRVPGVSSAGIAPSTLSACS